MKRIWPLFITPSRGYVLTTTLKLDGEVVVRTQPRDSAIKSCHSVTILRLWRSIVYTLDLQTGNIIMYPKFLMFYKSHMVVMGY